MAGFIDTETDKILHGGYYFFSELLVYFPALVVELKQKL